MTKNATAVEDSEPEGIEEFRRGLIRRMNDIRKEWRSCKEATCRRAKACVAPNLTCLSRLPKLTPEQHARAGVDLYRALQRRLAELGGEAAVEASLSAQEETAHEEETRRGQRGSSPERGAARANPANAIRCRTRGRCRR
jgi:hypothetical protein